MITRRLLETLAMTIIGDSVLCIISPQRHTQLWLDGPAWWQRTWRPFVQHPSGTRLLGALGLGIGIWLAWKQEDRIIEQPVSHAKRTLQRLAEAVH